MSQYYYESGSMPKIVFDRLVDPQEYEGMLEVFEDLRGRCGERRPYDDVLELTLTKWLVARKTVSDGGHHRLVFYDEDPLWTLLRDLGREDALRPYVPDEPLLKPLKEHLQIQ